MSENTVKWHPYPEEKPPYGFDLWVTYMASHFYGYNGRGYWGLIETVTVTTYSESAFARMGVSKWALAPH